LDVSKFKTVNFVVAPTDVFGRQPARLTVNAVVVPYHVRSKRHVYFVFVPFHSCSKVSHFVVSYSVLRCISYIAVGVFAVNGLCSTN
jgi:hypothetical protein